MYKNKFQTFTQYCMCEGNKVKQSGFEQTVAIKELKTASHWCNKSVRLLSLFGRIRTCSQDRQELAAFPQTKTPFSRHMSQWPGPQSKNALRTKISFTFGRRLFCLKHVACSCNFWIRKWIESKSMEIWQMMKSEGDYC